MMKGREKNGENELDLLWLHMLYEGFDDAKEQVQDKIKRSREKIHDSRLFVKRIS